MFLVVQRANALKGLCITVEIVRLQIISYNYTYDLLDQDQLLWR